MKTEEVLLSEQIFLDYKGSDRKEWENHFIEDREFYFGEQYDQEVKEAYERLGLLAAPVNETLPAIDQIVADLTSNDPRFSAIAMEDSDYNKAPWVSDLFLWIWTISKGQSKIERMTRDFCEGGVGCLMAYPDSYADNGNGEIKITDIDPLEVYVDPLSKEPDSSDARSIIISKLLSDGVIELNYPNFDFANAEQEAGNDFSRQRANTQGQTIFSTKPLNTKYYRSIERFTKVRVPRFYVSYQNFEKVFEEQDEFNSWVEQPAVIVTKVGFPDRYYIDDTEVADAIGIYEEYGDTYHLIRDEYGNVQIQSGVEDSTYSIKGSTTKLTITTRKDLIEQGVLKYDEPKVTRIKRVLSIGGIELANEILPLEDYPIVTAMLDHNRNPYASGDVRVIKPLQEQLNILDQRIQSYLRSATTIRGFVQQGSGVKRLLDDSGDTLGMELYEIDMETGSPPVFAQVPPLPGGIFQQRENIIRQIQRIIGAYSFQDGDATNAPRTLGATDRIDEFMRRRSAYKKRKIEAMLNQLAKAISQYIPHVYTYRKAIRLSEPNNRMTVLNDPKENPEGIEIINNVIDIKYDVRFISGSMLPSNRAQERAELMEAYQLGMLKDPRWWIQKTNFENIEEVLQGESLVSQMQGTIGQMEEQIKNLKGDLQTANREVIQANQKVSEEKAKTKLDKLVNKMESLAMLTQQRLNDLVKNKKRSK